MRRSTAEIKVRGRTGEGEGMECKARPAMKNERASVNAVRPRAYVKAFAEVEGR